jgi:hypothetical protein
MFLNTWSTLIDSLKKRITFLKLRNLSLKGRALTAGLLLASKIWYTSYIFPPLMKHVDEIQRLLNGWVRGDSKSLPAASIIQLPKREGGWNLTNIKSAILARNANTAHKLLFSNENWAKTKRSEIHHLQMKTNRVQKNYKNKDWPTRHRRLIQTWFKADRPQQVHFDTASTVLYFKKNIYLHKVWPDTPYPLFKRLHRIDLFPQTLVNAWRYHRKALPLKERVFWSSSIDSVFCRWCSSSPQTHEHFLRDCSLTKKIVNELQKNLGPLLAFDPIIRTDPLKLSIIDLWLSSWLIDYVWRSSARLNLDEDLTEQSVIMAAPHVLRLDAKSYSKLSSSKTNKIVMFLKRIVD